MTEFVENPETGEWLRRDAGQPDWQPSNVEEWAASKQDPIEAVFAAGKRTVQDTADLAAAGLSAAVSGTMGMGAAPTETAAFERMGGREAAREAGMRESPIASTIGENFDIITGAGAIGRQAIKRQMKDRVKDAIEGSSAAQLRSLPGGRAGMRVEQMLETTGLDEVSTRPFIRVKNSKLINAVTMRRIGGDAIQESLALNGGKINKEIAEEATSKALARRNAAVPDDVKIDFEGAEGTLGRVKQLIDDAKWLEPADKKLAEKAVWTGEHYKNVKRVLGRRMDALARTDPEKSDYIRETMKQIDKIVESTSGVDMAGFREGNGAYRMWIALRKRQAAIGEEGWINPKSFRGAINDVYGQEVRRGNYSGLDEPTRDLVQMLDRAIEIGHKAPDSGTARRLFLPGLAAGLGIGGT
ncbi:MAG: hypothetical protein GY758_00990 [Fuerstiella sp.]|nr:hypothetical protein [Fuerstiella sp.]